jgi:hypothetical protein
VARSLVLFESRLQRRAGKLLLARFERGFPNARYWQRQGCVHASSPTLYRMISRINAFRIRSFIF